MRSTTNTGHDVVAGAHARASQGTHENPGAERDLLGRAGALALCAAARAARREPPPPPAAGPQGP